MKLSNTLACAALFAVTALTATVSTASAMPIGAPSAPAGALVQDVRFGCGIGRHPNYYGRCVPNGGPVYYGRFYHPWHPGWRWGFHRRWY